MNSPADERQGPKLTPLPNPLPARRGEGEATPRSLSASIQRQWGGAKGLKTAAGCGRVRPVTWSTAGLEHTYALI
jgi:hypothetical protein